MKKLILLPIFLVQLLSLMGCSLRSGNTQSKATLKTLHEKSISTVELEAFVEQIMERADVAGLSCAIINDSQVVYRKAFGNRNKSTGARNDEETVFAAASFSKALFAYLVMLLAEDGFINLDKPLYEYLAEPLYQYPAYADLEDDERYKQITARMVLSHTTGFPNLRSLEPDGRLKFLFSPGERNSYSGEGIMLLQMVVEAITGKDLETLAQEKIFHPLGMTHSSYVWQAAYNENIAFPHDEFGRTRGLSIQLLQSNAGAGGSLATTADDYARFICLGILNVDGRRKATIDEMLQPQIAIGGHPYALLNDSHASLVTFRIDILEYHDIQAGQFKIVFVVNYQFVFFLIVCITGNNQEKTCDIKSPFHDIKFRLTKY